MIKRLKYHEIDWEKYQKCLASSEQKVYSAERKFLDVTARNNWELLVYEDYEAIMPVPFIKKMGFKIVVNPKLTQQLGVFSKEDSVVLNEKFLDFLQNHYKIWYYAFNEKNNFKTNLETRKNFVLESDNYENIRQKYSPKRKRKLRLNPGVKEFSEIKENVGLEEAKNFIKRNMIGAENEKDKIQFLEIIKTFSDFNLLDFYGFYFKDELINLVAVYQEIYTSVLIGTYNIKDLVKYNGASNLIDFAIKKNIEIKKFDFEGGELSNMEEYFRGFRAEKRNYAVIKNSKKQLLLSFLKKR